MKASFYQRHLFTLFVVLFYLIPVTLFIFYSLNKMPRQSSWSILSFGLLMVACGTLIFIFFLYSWEQGLKQMFASSNQDVAEEPKLTMLEPHVPSNDVMNQEDMTADLKKLEAQCLSLQDDIQIKNQCIEQLEEDNKQLLVKAGQAVQDFADYKIFSEEQLKQKSLQLQSYQQTIEEQRHDIEKYQEQVQILDTKIHDLSYEIKTLLSLHDSEPIRSVASDSSKVMQFKEEADDIEDESDHHLKDIGSQISTAEQGWNLLRRCLHLAQKLHRAPYQNLESSPYYTIDQRRLFDSLRGETAGIVIVCSAKEHKLLFANLQTKIILGWSPEKFVQDFATLSQESFIEWKKSLQMLHSVPEAFTRLLIKTRQSQEILLNCHLGIVPDGLFKNYVMGVLYPHAATNHKFFLEEMDKEAERI